MATGKWERVGKGGKKSTGQKSQKSSKDSDKPVLNPHLDLTDVLKADQTKFCGLADDRAQLAPPTATAEKAAAASGSGKKQLAHKKKPHNSSKEQQPATVSLKDALDQLDAEEIKDFIEHAQEQHADDALAWFKELIGYFRQRLPTHDTSKETENIVSLVPMEIRRIVIGCFKPLPNKTLELMFIHCLNDITTLSHKGGDVVAVQLMVELLKLCHPSIVDHCTELAQVMLQSCISRPRESVPLLRAVLLDNFQQQHNTLHGLKAWCTVMLPLIRETDNVPRQVITFAVDYSCDLFAGLPHPPALPLSAAEFVSLLQTATPTQIAADQGMVNKFSQLMLSISACAVTLKNGKPSQCFQKLLWILEKHNEPRPPQQLLKSAMLCVSHDALCQNVWKNYHHSNRANRLLVRYLAQHWAEVERLATHNKCMDSLLAILRSPNMVAIAAPVDAPWNKLIGAVHVTSSSTTLSLVVSKLMMLFGLFVVLLLLGNYYCNHSNNNSIICNYIKMCVSSVTWASSHVEETATTLQSWMLRNIPYWDSLSYVGYQVMIGVVLVYATAWDMLLSLWQLFQNCWDHVLLEITKM